MALGLHQRQQNPKLRTIVFMGCGGNSAVMELHNLSTEGQANAAARVLVDPVQALEDRKYLLTVFLLEADAVIPDHQFDVSK